MQALMGLSLQLGSGEQGGSVRGELHPPRPGWILSHPHFCSLPGDPAHLGGGN